MKNISTIFFIIILLSFKVSTEEHQQKINLPNNHNGNNHHQATNHVGGGGGHGNQQMNHKHGGNQEQHNGVAHGNQVQHNGQHNLHSNQAQHNGGGHGNQQMNHKPAGNQLHHNGNVHNGKQKNNKKPPHPPMRTLKWKPKPRPKGRPPPPKGFSGFRPAGWGKGGHAYNDRGEKEKRKSSKKFDELMKNIFGEKDFEDNDILLPEEFNGREVATPGEYPHMAAIGVETEFDDVDKKTIEWKCGGSLIDAFFIITAAHCTDFGGEPPTHVKIGDVYLKKREQNNEPQRIKISDIFPHPYYNESSYYYDIALIKLKRAAVFTPFVLPIRLWSFDDIPFELVFAMGYGSTKFGLSPTNILTFLNISLIGNEECNKSLPEIPETEYGIIDSQICAMDKFGTKDTCQGDSGGPLQLNLPGRRRPRYSLIGITSYGLFCGSRTPSVYTRVFSYLDWIESIVWPEEKNVIEDIDDNSPAQ